MIEHLLRAENALALGLLDQAEAIYTQAVAHDPANAIALVGLSRVALERGDERASLGFARRARAIDPENGQAGRMVDRLEEVIRERGEPVPREASTTEPVPQTAWGSTPLSPPSNASQAPLLLTPPGAVTNAPAVAEPAVAPPAADPAPPWRGLLRRLTGRS
jgi:hypothetical protein